MWLKPKNLCLPCWCIWWCDNPFRNRLDTTLKYKIMDFVVIRIQDITSIVGNDAVWIHVPNHPDHFLFIFTGKLQRIILFSPENNVFINSKNPCRLHCLALSDFNHLFCRLIWRIPQIVGFTTLTKTEHDDLYLCSIFYIFRDSSATSPHIICSMSTDYQYPSVFHHSCTPSIL